MRARRTVAVLVYHSVAATTTPSFAKLTVDPALFEEHLAALREQSLDVIPFSQVPAALAEGRRAVAITIDDGLADAGPPRRRRCCATVCLRRCSFPAHSSVRAQAGCTVRTVSGRC